MSTAESLDFMASLFMDVFEEQQVVINERFEKSHVTFTKNQDGTWLVEDFDDWKRREGVLAFTSVAKPLDKRSSYSIYDAEIRA